MNLDQYYTNEKIALRYIEETDKYFPFNNYTIVEPSAGTGAFYNRLPQGSIGLDLDPKAEGVTQADFLTWDCPEVTRPIMIIGNPPFGKNSSKAVAFFNHAAKFSEVIAFIVPRTFRKASLTNRLDLRFHLMHEEEVPPMSFVFEGEPYDVPCVFQIWERQNRSRAQLRLPTSHVDFNFSTPERAQFVVQRVGKAAGAIKLEFSQYTSRNFYYIEPLTDGVLARFIRIDFNTVKHDTAGFPSISKAELVALYQASATNARLDPLF